MSTAEEPDAGPGPPSAAPDPDQEPEREPVVVRDRRRSRAAASGKHAAGAAGPTSAGQEHPAEPATGGGKHAAPEPDGAGQPSAEPPSAGQPSAERPGGKHAAPPQEPTGAAAAQTPPGGGGLGAELSALRGELEERTRDLQRLNAEYANYRRRVERDRNLASDEATAAVFRALLPVFDDLDRAREHGELAEGVAAIVDQLLATAGKFGLAPFGEKGDRFDPTFHEAVAHLTSPEVTEPTCVDVLRRGYQLGDRLLRPAMVAVAGPGEATDDAAAGGDGGQAGSGDGSGPGPG